MLENEEKLKKIPLDLASIPLQPDEKLVPDDSINEFNQNFTKQSASLSKVKKYAENLYLLSCQIRIFPPDSTGMNEEIFYFRINIILTLGKLLEKLTDDQTLNEYFFKTFYYYIYKCLNFDKWNTPHFYSIFSSYVQRPAASFDKFKFQVEVVLNCFEKIVGDNQKICSNIQGTEIFSMLEENILKLAEMKIKEHEQNFRREQAMIFQKAMIKMSLNSLKLSFLRNSMEVEAFISNLDFFAKNCCMTESERTYCIKKIEELTLIESITRASNKRWIEIKRKLFTIAEIFIPNDSQNTAYWDKVKKKLQELQLTGIGWIALFEF